jgi:hypothetical protein
LSGSAAKRRPWADFFDDPIKQPDNGINFGRNCVTIFATQALDPSDHPPGQNTGPDVVKFWHLAVPRGTIVNFLARGFTGRATRCGSSRATVVTAYDSTCYGACPVDGVTQDWRSCMFQRAADISADQSAVDRNQQRSNDKFLHFAISSDSAMKEPDLFFSGLGVPQRGTLAPNY